MKDHQPIPTALQIVAAIFLLYGVGTVVGMLVLLASGSVRIDFWFLGIPTFFGLRRFSIGWRTFALMCIWFGLIICPIAFLHGVTGSTPTYFKLFGIGIGQIAPVWLSVASVPMFLLQLWQYRVLTRPDIRALFFPA